MAAPESALTEPIIHLHRNVVEHLSRDVWAVFESTPLKGMEIGGLLLGEADSQTHIVEVRDFDALLCEQRPDHRFVLSDSERCALQKMLAARGPRHGGDLKVVGCYRSQIGDGLTVSKDDLSFARACIGNSFGVFLLIKPAPNGDLSAGFFFWGTDSTYSFQAFPFDTRRLAPVQEGPSSHGALSRPKSVEQFDEPSPVESKSSAVCLRATAFNAAPPLEPEEERYTPRAPVGQSTWAPVSRAPAWRGTRFHLQWQLPVAVLAVVLSFAGYAYRNRTPAVVAADAAGLALQVERCEKDLRVSWDRDAEAVRRASKGVLLIRDGDLLPRELQFDVEQLRNGGAVYSPMSARVQFQLEVTEADNRKTTENVLTVLAPQQNLIQASVADIPRPDGASVRDQTQLEHPAPFPPKRAAPSEATMQVSEVATGQSRGKGKSTDAFVPAQPIRETRANLTASIISTLTSPVEVQVKVRIDESGHVVRADPVALNGPASHALFAATENAALLWKFAPAMLGNQPIASEAVLKFSYAPRGTTRPPGSSVRAGGNSVFANFQRLPPISAFPVP
jgi:hypothetical protein